jgi:hypothetical protein
MSERTPEQWDDEFEDIIDQPGQDPFPVVGEDAVEDLGPAIAEGPDIRSVLEAYKEYKRDMEGMDFE